MKNVKLEEEMPRKCKEIEEIAVLEAEQKGVGTASAHKAATVTGIKRKAGYCEGEFSYSASLVRRRIHRRVIVGETENRKSDKASSSKDPCGSCCSSHGSTDLDEENSEFSDLEVRKEQEEESVGTSASTYGLDSSRERRETTPPLNDVLDESLKLKIIAELSRNVNSSRLSDEAKMPYLWKTELEDFSSIAEKDHLHDVNSGCQFDEAKMTSKDELEEFFSVAENDHLRQYADKYNFDFVKEEPLDGRYEWVRVKP